MVKVLVILRRIPFLIPAYTLDFLCIHPFTDGNGRLSRLLTLLLLYRAGYEVGRFISLERIIEDAKEGYYESLHRSSEGWHEGKHDLLPFTEYLLGVLIRAYREFEERVGKLTDARGAKTQMVMDAIERLPNVFRMADLERLCPTVSREMIRHVLDGLKKTTESGAKGRALPQCGETTRPDDSRSSHALFGGVAQDASLSCCRAPH